MKTLLLVGAIVLALIALQQVNSQTCSDNPLIPALKEYIQSQNRFVQGEKGKGKQDAQSKKAKDQEFTQSDLNDLDNATSGSNRRLGMCKDYDGEQSCCTSGLVQKFRKLTKGFFLSRSRKKPNAGKVFRKVVDIIKENNCVDKKKLKEIGKDLMKKKDVKKAFNEIRKCQKKAIHAQASLMRGTICQVCMDPSQFDTFFDGEGEDLQLLVHPSNMDAYDDAMEAAFTCAEKFNKNLKTAVKAVIDKLPADCSSAKTAVKNWLDAHVIRKPTCKNVEFFKDGCLKYLEDGEDGEDSPPENNGGRRILLKRMLVDSSYQESNSGVNGAYETDPEEEKELDGIEDAQQLDEDDGGDGGDGDGDGDGKKSSSGSVLGVSLFAIAGFFLI